MFLLMLKHISEILFSCLHYLENIIGTFSAEVVLAGQDDHGFCKHFQAYGTNQLFLQVLHGIHFDTHTYKQNKKRLSEH